MSLVSYFPAVIQFTILTNNQCDATKVFWLDENGQLKKQSAANIYEGYAERVAIRNLGELGDRIGRLQPKRALCFGVPKLKEARLLTQETLRSGSYADAIARDRDHFSFRQAQSGVLMLDCDPHQGQEPRSWQDIDRIVAEIIPAWRETQRLWRASSSAYLYRGDETELIGMGGWRCYVVVDDASAIPSLAIPSTGAYIYQRLWETGHGHIVISQSGQALDRSLIPLSGRVRENRRVVQSVQSIRLSDVVPVVLTTFYCAARAGHA